MDGDGQRQRAPRAKDREKFELAVEVIVCMFVALALSDEGHRSIAIIKANHASSISPVYGRPFNRAIVCMEALGLVTVEVGYRHDRWSRLSSSLTRTPDFELPPVEGWEALRLEDHGRLIVLNRYKDGRRHHAILKPPPNAEREMASINEHIRTSNIEVDDAVNVASWPSTITDRLMTPHHRQLHRVFNGDYESGGRAFGGWWQTLPREQRKHIRIDGEPVVNVDFTAMHLRLAYAEAGCDPQGDDLYDLTGTDHLRPDWQTLREGRKRLVSVMFTSKRKLRQWPGVTPKEREDIRSLFGGTKVKDAVAAIRERHKAIAEWFECGRGLRLQRTESDILVSVLLKLNARGVTALPIHDAVLVARSHGETAKRIMEAKSRKVTGAKIPAKVSGV
jgi:hypothetical protein